MDRGRRSSGRLGALSIVATIAFGGATLAETPAPPGDARLAYGSLCPGAGTEGIRVLVTATSKGPKVTLTRRGRDPGPFETLDVNFAHVSRRLFFKARTAEGLIEFQGRALADDLAGLYSDDEGVTRAIRLPRTSDGATCQGDRR